MPLIADDSAASATTATTAAPLPDWVTELRPGQMEAAQAIADDFANGVDKVFFDGPVGSGKTLVAELVRRKMAREHALYVCSTKSLQDQFVSDFPYARVLKGRANYPTADFPEKFLDPYPYQVSCADCTIPASRAAGEDPPVCDYCHPDEFSGLTSANRCPYNRAKGMALWAELAVVNTSYFLTEANYVGDFSRRFGLVIVDECDLIERELMGFSEIQISAKRMKEYRIEPPRLKTVKESWVEWALATIPIVNGQVTRLRDRMRRSFSPQTARALNGLVTLKGKLGQLIEDEGEGWVYDPPRDGSIVFKQVRVDREAEGRLWQHGKQWLLMSATIIDPAELADSLGIESYTVHRMESTYDPTRRPVYVRPAANMSYNTKVKETPKLVVALKKIFNDHPNDRILVHSVSYELTTKLAKFFSHNKRVLHYTNAQGRGQALKDYKERAGAILIAPSLDRGIDLPYELCDVVVICKVPFPNMGDKQISTRLYGGGRKGQLWYEVQTVRTLVQMMGRGMRAADDRCEIYVLDSQFIDKIWKSSRRLIPKYIRESIVWKVRG